MAASTDNGEKREIWRGEIGEKLPDGMKYHSVVLYANANANEYAFYQHQRILNDHECINNLVYTKMKPNHSQVPKKYMTMYMKPRYDDDSMYKRFKTMFMVTKQYCAVSSPIPVYHPSDDVHVYFYLRLVIHGIEGSDYLICRLMKC